MPHPSPRPRRELYWANNWGVAACGQVQTILQARPWVVGLESIAEVDFVEDDIEIKTALIRYEGKDDRRPMTDDEIGIFRHELARMSRGALDVFRKKA